MSEERIGLGSLRKNKTPRPVTIAPENAAKEKRTMPDQILDHGGRKRASELPKSIRIGLDTHTALQTIALLQDKPLYQALTDIVENYVQEQPSAVRKQIRANVMAKQSMTKTRS